MVFEKNRFENCHMKYSLSTLNDNSRNMGPQELSLGIFGMLTCMVIFFMKQILEIRLACQDGVTEVNNTKSGENFFTFHFH